MRRNALEQAFLDQDLDIDKLNDLNLFVLRPLQEILGVIAEDFEYFEKPNGYRLCGVAAIGERIRSLLWAADHIISYCCDLCEDRNSAFDVAEEDKSKKEEAKSSATEAISPEPRP